jgi:Arc/MetJ-type ribon-helix-helix transcriptional regulator
MPSIIVQKQQRATAGEIRRIAVYCISAAGSWKEGIGTMNLQLDADARIFERLKTGIYSSPIEVVIAGIQLLEARDRERSADLELVRSQIFSGLQQLDRGEALDGEQVFSDLLAELDIPRDKA